MFYVAKRKFEYAKIYPPNPPIASRLFLHSLQSKFYQATHDIRDASIQTKNSGGKPINPFKRVGQLFRTVILHRENDKSGIWDMFSSGEVDTSSGGFAPPQKQDTVFGRLRSRLFRKLATPSLVKLVVQ